MLAVACGLRRGLTLSFPEDAATQRTDLREIGPDVMFSPPRIWESMLSEVQVRIDEAGWLKRRVFGWAYGVGDRRPRPDRGRRAGPCACARVADAVGLRPVRDQLGLLRIRRCYTGGAPLSPDVFRFFHAIGVNLKQIYGQTEICGIAVAHRDGDRAVPHRRRADPRHRAADRRRRRDPAALGRACSAATCTTRRPPLPPSTPTAGCTPATPDTSTTASSS